MASRIVIRKYPWNVSVSFELSWWFAMVLTLLVSFFFSLNLSLLDFFQHFLHHAWWFLLSFLFFCRALCLTLRLSIVSLFRLLIVVHVHWYYTLQNILITKMYLWLSFSVVAHVWQRFSLTRQCVEWLAKYVLVV